MFTHNIVKNIFTFTGRSGRIEYLVFTTIYAVIGIPLAFFLPFPAEMEHYGLGLFGLLAHLAAAKAEPSALVIFALLDVIVFWIIIAAVTIRRIRDVGLNPWFFLVMFIPYADFIFHLFLIFAPKDTMKKK